MADLQLGVIATPKMPAAAADRLADDLRARLAVRYPEVQWDVGVRREALVDSPTAMTELLDRARERMLDEGWDLAVVVTDLPLRLSRRPLLSHASPTHGVALVSLPAHGAIRLEERLLDSSAGAVAVLVGDSERLVEIVTDVEPRGGGVPFLARVISGNIRLLLGMVRANHPWWFAARLSRALIGALAVGSSALVTSDVWRIAAAIDKIRLVGLTLITVAVAIVALVLGHGLWERAADRRVREQVMLFNVATAITLGIGIGSLYAAVFVGALVAAALLIEPHLFHAAVGRPVGVSDYLRLAWLAASLATVGGALGGALESDAAVREAAYAYRPED
jgi:uncharacterized membrane protein